MKKIFIKNKQAFTIIEILVVIFIIVIISSLVMVSFKLVKTNNRDAKRLSDISQLRLAIENYRLFEGEYPADVIGGSTLKNLATGNTYLNPVPINDSYENLIVGTPDGKCSYDDYHYVLASSTDYFTLSFCLEKKMEKYPAGEKCFISSSGEIINSTCP